MVRICQEPPFALGECTWGGESLRLITSEFRWRAWLPGLLAPHIDFLFAVKGLVEGVLGHGGAAHRCRVGGGRSVVVGSGVADPKSRPSGCEAGHAGVRDVPGCPPGPVQLSARSWQ
jgi:hypothetical protein